MNYSQNKEEQIISQYFDGYIGTVLDLGANDGVTLSNSRHFIENGWGGCLVEASPVTFTKLESLYSDNDSVDCINVGISDKNESLTFHDSGTHLGGDDTSLVSTFDARELIRWEKNTTFEKSVVQCVDFMTLLGKTQHTDFDFITMDIEGFEPIVLPQIDLTNTKCLCIEWNSKPELAGMFKRIAERYGLQEHHRNNENLIFTR